ncbi:MAG: hypothetical protein JJU22_14465 [Gammaproteobacteria bacterium]|nr:hypothetical protein [Gammaproteobacteria bacterium]
MTTSNLRDGATAAGAGAPAEGERFMYVMAERPVQDGDEISLLDLWNILWDGKWLGIAITALCAMAAVIYALTATEWYRAEVLLVPAEERSSQGLSGQLGGLAGLAGISVGGGSSAEALAILRSRQFLSRFIEDLDLLPVLLAERWDAEAGRWIVEAGEDAPDIRDAVRFMQDNVLSAREDSQTRLVTVAVEWTDPELATLWANALVERLNDRMRQQALVEAEANVAYLQEQLGATTLVTLQQTIGRLLENEMQKLMLARGNEQFAFRVLDPAEVPKRRARPNRTLIVALAVVLGGMLSILAIFLRHALRRRKLEVSSDA